jgi:opacity protein-like surface antigen
MMRLDSRIRSFLVIAVAAALVALGAAGREVVRAQTHSHTPSPSADKAGWLVRLGPDARVAAIERQLRGFETTMAEVAYRYTEMYFGGIDGNWGYAEHMAHELGGAITTGLERRPQYRKSAEAIFLKGPYPQIVDAIKAKNPALFKQRIEALRAACTACHAAEAHPFIKIGVPTVRRNPVVNE